MNTQDLFAQVNEKKITVNEILLDYRPNPDVISEQITGPHDAVNFIQNVWNQYLHLKESFYVILLDNAKNVTGYSMISMGGSTATIVDPADVVRLAVMSKCNSILLAHNHPSGQARESKADIQLTKRINDVCKILGIPVDDHIILAGDSYLSFKAKGLL